MHNDFPLKYPCMICYNINIQLPDLVMNQQFFAVILKGRKQIRKIDEDSCAPFLQVDM